MDFPVREIFEEIEVSSGWSMVERAPLMWNGEFMEWATKTGAGGWLSTTEAQSLIMKKLFRFCNLF